MSMFTERLRLHLAPVQVPELDEHGEPVLDRYGDPVYTEQPRDKDTHGWFEPRTSGEDTAAREQYVSGWWVYLDPSEPVQGLEGVTLYTPEGAVRTELDGSTEAGYQPPGFELEGYYLFAVRRVSG